MKKQNFHWKQFAIVGLITHIVFYNYHQLLRLSRLKWQTLICLWKNEPFTLASVEWFFLERPVKFKEDLIHLHTEFDFSADVDWKFQNEVNHFTVPNILSEENQLKLFRKAKPWTSWHEVKSIRKAIKSRFEGLQNVDYPDWRQLGCMASCQPAVGQTADCQLNRFFPRLTTVTRIMKSLVSSYGSPCDVSSLIYDAPRPAIFSFLHIAFAADD